MQATCATSGVCPMVVTAAVQAPDDGIPLGCIPDAEIEGGTNSGAPNLGSVAHLASRRCP